MENLKILVVDDEARMRKLVRDFLVKAGYTVLEAEDGNEAMEVFYANKNISLLILDVMMPGMDGFNACTKIREICNVPIIFLTGRDSEDDKVQGLLLGGDDYMVKPYSLRELDARIQVLIRRYHISSATSPSILNFPPLTIDKDKHKAFYNDEEISLSNKEYDFLCLLASSPDKIFTFEEIGNAIWNGYIESDRKTIMVTASRLRKKLDSYTGLSDYIETVWSQGYRFNSKAM